MLVTLWKHAYYYIQLVLKSLQKIESGSILWLKITIHWTLNYYMQRETACEDALSSWSKTDYELMAWAQT